jgi:hypothetical protein
MPKKSQPSFVKPGMSVVYWECKHVSYGLRPEDMVVGLRLGICEHAGRTFPRWEVPGNSEFIAGTVTEVKGGMMTIKYDNHPNGALAINCSTSFAKYCIWNTEPVKLIRKRKPPVKRLSRFNREPVI